MMQVVSSNLLINYKEESIYIYIYELMSMIKKVVYINKKFLQTKSETKS